MRKQRCNFVVSEYVNYGIGRTGMFEKPMTLLECAKLVKSTFNVPDVRVFGDLTQIVRTAAICPGSGKDMIANAKASKSDVYISGDFGHHNGIDANEDGVLIIDAGHQGIEKIFITYMKTYIHKRCEEIEVITEDSNAPFITI